MSFRSSGNTEIMSPQRLKGLSTFGTDVTLLADLLSSPNPSASIHSISPFDSAMSYSLSSPPRNLHSQHQSLGESTIQSDTINDLLASTFSPSIFSPDMPQRQVGNMIHTKAVFSSNTSPLFEVSDLSPLMSETKNLTTGSGSSYRRPLNRKVSVSVRNPEFLEPPQDSGQSSVKRSEDASKRNSSRKQLTKAPVITPDSSAASSRSHPSPELKRKLSLDKSVATPSSSIVLKEAIPGSAKDIYLRKNLLKSDPNQVRKSTGESSTELEEEIDMDSNKPKVTCKCKKSRCLKLYCDCFAVLNYCNPLHCKCNQCHNSEEHEDARSEAIRLTKERNNLAFKEKITDQVQHVAGCHCKNSHCLKKYCECFTGGALCGGNCKCQSCENYAGSTELVRVRNNQYYSDSDGVKKKKDSPSSVALISPDAQDEAGVQKNTPPKRNPSVTTPKPSAYSLRGHRSSATSSIEEAEQIKKVSRLAVKKNVIEPLSAPRPTALSSSGADVTKGKKRNVAGIKKVAFALPQVSPSEEEDEVEDAEDEVGQERKRQRSSSNHPLIHEEHGTKFLQLKHKKPVEVFNFFGEDLVPVPKASFLLVLEHLTDKEIYDSSLVNVMWNRAAFDEALWEAT